MCVMEQKQKRLFDYQKFNRNPRLDALLSDALARYEGDLADADLELVSAAGEEQAKLPEPLPQENTP